MQTILGSGGAIGIPLAKALKSYTDKVRLAARNPRQVNGDDELMVTDLTDNRDVERAVEGSEVVYLTVGLTYKTRTWQREWPVVMRNVIHACIAHNTRLVFLDNVYMYAPDEIHHMKESSAVGPVSKKGKVRAQIAKMLLDATRQKGLNALIARSADFYGPGADNSPLQSTVFEPFGKGKKAMWQVDASRLHAFTYTLDAAKAMALLGNTDDAYGEIWHLPTSSERLTGKQFIELIAAEMNVEPRFSILSPWMMRLIGIFVPIVGELREMSYQYDRDYVFDSSKFESRFSFTPVAYAEGVRETVNKKW